MNSATQQTASVSAHRKDELKGWLKATPTQRLAWLEEVLAIAYQSGALPRKQPRNHQEG